MRRAEQPADRPGRLGALAEPPVSGLRLGIRTGIARRFEQHQTGRQFAGVRHDRFQRLDRHGTQSLSQPDLDRALPARFDFELLDQTRRARQPPTRQPVAALDIGIGQRRFLERRQRGQTSLGFAQTGADLIERVGQRAQCGLMSGQGLEHRVAFVFQGIDPLVEHGFTLAQFL